MKKAQTSKHRKLASDEMRPHYDFDYSKAKPNRFAGKRGIRGKYYRAYRQGHTVKIYKADGTVSTQHFTLEDGAVMLEPDVRKYFPDSDAVNEVLRSLITLIPTKRKTARKSRKT